MITTDMFDDTNSIQLLNKITDQQMLDVWCEMPEQDNAIFTLKANKK